MKSIFAGWVKYLDPNSSEKNDAINMESLTITRVYQHILSFEKNKKSEQKIRAMYAELKFVLSLLCSTG